MQNRPAQGVPTDAIQDGSPKGPLGDSFLAGKRYPGDTIAPAPPPPPAPTGPASRRIFTRVVLPLAIFLVAIGALAWVTQYLPSRQGARKDSDPNPTPGAKAKLDFVDEYHVAIWEPERFKAELAAWKKDGEKGPPPQPVYAAEYEVSSDSFQDGGHYDFEFLNPGDAPVVVGLDHKTCQCASIEGYVLNTADYARYQKLKAKADPATRSRQTPNEGFPAKPLVEEDKEGMVVPARTHGIIRLFWVGRERRDPAHLRLSIRLWVSPQGKYAERQLTSLQVTIAYVKPVRFFPERLKIGAVSPDNPTVSEVLHCWSATRDLDVRVAKNLDDPRFVVQVKKLETDQEREKLGEDLRAQNIYTHVRSAYRIEVTVHEQKEGKQLDLGQFRRPLDFDIKGNGDKLPYTPPWVVGRVLGDVKVGTLEDDGAIDLKYIRTDQSTRASGKIWAKPGMEFEYAGFQPPVLNLKVEQPRRLPKESLPNWQAWEIRMTIPAGLEPGPLPEESGIVLRVKGSDRKIRIPLIGSAGRR